jgi:hypothetical protein
VNKIEIKNGVFSVDAELIGEALGLEPAQVQAQMRAGKITSLCEHGVGEDAGRYRLTFFYEQRRLRLVIDENGNTIERSVDSAIGPRRHAQRDERC